MQRTVSVLFRAITGQYRAEVGEAARATEQIGRAAETTADKTQRAGSRSERVARSITQHARENSAAWTSTGGAILATAAPVAALGTAAMRTGIQYNQLRQTTVAALTSITGSAEQANAQMDRLDEFASTSPFARDVFIRAQQQMLGFGIEAQKVVPYLDAIQNAVAAAGGSNHDIAELSRIFSQISASSKITATDLREFGNRGIDAATLIGTQMGKTGAQIRDDITDGALDAGDALDALALAMSETYEGAAAGVKDSFAGATDRVKAAFRDLSATVFDPLVSAQGGGILVTLFNQFADFLRLVESLPDPVLQVGGALATLATGAAVLGGTFMVTYPRLVGMVDSLASMGVMGRRAQAGVRRLPAIMGRIGRTAGPIALAAAATGLLMSHLNKPGVYRNTDELAEALGRVAEQGRNIGETDMASLFEQLPEALGGSSVAGMELAEVFERLGNKSLTDNIASTAGTIIGVLLPGFRDYMDQYEEGAEAIDQMMAALSRSGELETAQGHFNDLWVEMGATSQAARELLDHMPAYESALKTWAESQGLAATEATILQLATGTLNSVLAQTPSEVQAAEEALEHLTENLAQTATGFIDTMGAWDAVIEKNKEAAQASADASKSTKDSWEDFYDGHTVSLNEYLDELDRQVAAQEEWQGNMVRLAGRVSEGTLAHLATLGTEGAPLVAALVDASDEELARFEDVVARSSDGAGEAFAAGLLEAIPLIKAAMTTMSDEAVNEMARGIGSGQITVQNALDLWGLNVGVEVDADTGTARDQVNELLVEVDGSTGTVSIEGDAMPGGATLADFLGRVDSSAEDVTINGDTVDGEQSLAEFLQMILDSDEPVTIGGDNLNGRLALQQLVALILAARPEVIVGASMANAEAAVQAFINRYDGKTIAQASVDVYTRLIDQGVTRGHAASGARYTAQAMAHYGVGHATGGHIEGYAFGGAVYGPGTGTSDSILATVGPTRKPIRLSNGEHVWTDAEVRAAGGHDAMYAMRAAVRSGDLASVLGLAAGGRASYSDQYQQTYMPVATGSTVINQTVENHAIPADQANEFARATLFSFRQISRDSIHARVGV